MAKIYTSTRVNAFEASCKGGRYYNCFDDNGRIHVVCDRHGLGAGQLKVEFLADFTDGMFPDGLRRVVTPAELDITLVDGAGGCPFVPGADIFLPVVSSGTVEGEGLSEAEIDSIIENSAVGASD